MGSSWNGPVLSAFQMLYAPQLITHSGRIYMYIWELPFLWLPPFRFPHHFSAILANPNSDFWLQQPVTLQCSPLVRAVSQKLGCLQGRSLITQKFYSKCFHFLQVLFNLGHSSVPLSNFFTQLYNGFLREGHSERTYSTITWSETTVTNIYFHVVKFFKISPNVLIIYLLYAFSCFACFSPLHLPLYYLEFSVCIIILSEQVDQTYLRLETNTTCISVICVILR